MRDLKYMTVVAVAALGLALAGCGSDGGPSQADLDAERDRTEQQMMMVTQLQNQINALRTQLGLDPTDDLGDSIQGLQTEVDRLQGEIDRMAEAERMAAEEAARMAAAATGKALFAALAGTKADGSDNALANIGAPTLSAAGLAIDAASNAGTLTTDPASVTLKAGDSAGSLGSWAGTSYALTTGTGATKVTNEAVVYNNKGPGRSRSFSALGYTVATADSTDDFKDYITLDEKNDLPRIGGNAFTHSGTQQHPYAPADGKFETRGTYDGADGLYRCSGTCSSTNDGKGSPSALTGVWHFKPDGGANAMAHQPDDEYLYFGWWVSKDNDGMPTAASAFVGIVEPNAGDLDTGGDLTALAGSATYVGHAAGKFALDYSQNKVLDGASDGGHFTADATLEATFGTGATAGVTGMIDNFRLNDGTEDPGWSVSLARGALGSSGGSITAPTADPTVWSMGGTAAPASGTWSGTMYDEMPGNPPGGDGSNVPTTVTGTFYTEYDDVGRMVGAFGANKQ